MSRIKVLVATIGFGAGHNKAGEAVAEAIQDEFPGAEVKIVDFLGWEKSLRDFEGNTAQKRNSPLSGLISRFAL